MRLYRSIIRLALALAALGLLAGAGQAEEKKLTLLTWTAPQNEPMFRAWMKAFESEHPDVKMEWLDKKGTEWAAFYQTQVVAGTAPDIINVQAGLWVEYAENGLLLDLTPHFQKDKGVRDRYVDRMLAYWEKDGHQYCLPYYMNKSLLYWNKELFKNAGLDGPPKSLDELLNQAAKIAELSPETTGFLTLNFDWQYWSLFAAEGIDMFTPDLKKAAFNTPKMLEFVKRLAKATEDGTISKVSWTGRWRENNSAFASGTVGMYMAHGGAYYNFKTMGNWIGPDTVGATSFPGGWGTLLPHGFCVSNSTKYPELAWEFVKMITNDQWAEGTSRRIIRTAGNKAADAKLLAHLKAVDPIGHDAMKAQGAHLDKLTGTWKTPLDAELQEAFWPELQTALLGQKDPKQALDDAERKVNRILSRSR